MQKLKELTNLIVDSIDDTGHEIVIKTQCDRTFVLYHDQDCCESVYIYDTKGNLNDLVGKQLKEVDWHYPELSDTDLDEPCDSYTLTDIVFITDDMTVISRWIGESNGYYSESVDLKEIIEN